MMYAVLQKLTTTEYHIECFWWKSCTLVMHSLLVLFIGLPLATSAVLQELTTTEYHIECFVVKIMYTGNAFIVGTVYRPPTCNIIDFNDILSNILEQIVHHSCFIKGDYLLDLMKHDKHPPTEIFFDVMYASYFIPVINRPTSVTMNTCTFIDNTCANQHDVRENQVHGILKTDINDHFFIILYQLQEITKL